ncbi:MAG: 1-acyl-sn-glycerol-3-phosphate acyltransferase [Burkholderiales bacterium]|jgi:1-acyl-sn-glycerol-3-phosphate acyltransferase|nr:1-acyl-sn-glycerol-3-phosphate acyltransferase [Burkholderiales bacterium]
MLQRFAHAVLRLLGWRVEFAPPPGPRGIIIVYPHTSNWDFVIGLLAKWAIGLPLRFVGKESLFRGFTGATLGRLMRLWGGRPVDRHRASGAVEQLADLMRSEPWFWLALSPEGTRRFQDHLRSGFYHLALAMQVPVGLAFIDYGRRAVGVRDYASMSGDVAADLKLLREFYADKRGLHPEQAATIAFRSPAATPGH